MQWTNNQTLLANYPAAGNAGFMACWILGHRLSGVPEPGRWAWSTFICGKA
jgi:hypothetical protein